MGNIKGANVDMYVYVHLEDQDLNQKTKKIFNSSHPGQNGHHFADDIFSYVFFVNEKFFILINISLKYIPKGAIYNKPAFVQMMAWRRIGNKPLSELLPTRFTDAYMRH